MSTLSLDRQYSTATGHLPRSDEFSRLKTVQGDLVRGVYIDAAGARMPFEDYAEQWRNGQVHRPSTAILVESHMRLHVYPTFGARQLGSIRPSEIQAWVKGRSAVLAPSTVELVYRYVAAIFIAAVADRLIASSPCSSVKLPKIDRPQVVPLANEAVLALAHTVPARYRALVMFAAGTGARQGECFGVTRDRLDMLRRTVRIDRQLQSVARGGVVLCPPKTAASVRTIPLPEVVLGELAAHMAAYPLGPDGFLFTTPQGGPLRRTRFSEVWRQAVRTAGAPNGTGFHALRHYYASLLIDGGESVKIVQGRLGHATASETLDTYGHLWPDTEDRTRGAVDRALCAPERTAQVPAHD